MTHKNDESSQLKFKRHPHREDPRPQHFHLIWPVSGLIIQAINEIEYLGVVPSHAIAQWY
jgi:hypothetical protein